MTGRARIALVSLLVLLIAGGVGFFFWYRAYSHEQKVKEYKKSLKADWSSVRDMADVTVAALTRLGSPSDLDSVVKTVGDLSAELSRIRSRAEKSPPPSGYGKVDEAEKSALESLENYLEMVSKLASGKNAADIEANRSRLENRARKARADVDDFLSKASFIKTGISGDLFQAGGMMQNAFKTPGQEAEEKEKQAVYDLVNTFMTADVKKKDYDLIWSLLSHKLHLFLDVFKVTRERFPEVWREAWGDNEPVDFYVSRQEITLSDPTHGVARVIVYLKKKPPRIEDIRVIKEAEGWRIDTYPFVGWLSIQD